MAQNREKGGRVVFIGNIPYGVSEEQICEIFGRAGTVLGFRLVYDKETGKPKGFGFLEYDDVDQAAAAVRNLNGFEIMGRQLKVDYSNDNGGGAGNRQGGQNDGNQQQPAFQSMRAPPPAHFDMNNAGQNGTAAGSGSALPPLPQGVDLGGNVSVPDAISRTMQTLQPQQLLDILSQMKSLSSTDPSKATELLQQAPQLAYATFQALLLLGLVDVSVLNTLIQQTGGQPPAPQPPQQSQQPPPMQYQQQPTYSQPPQQYQQHQYQQPPYAVSTPPVQQPAYHPPPQQQQSYQQPPPQQQDVYQQVLALTRDQIFGMKEPDRTQILQLRQQLGAPVQ